MRILPLILAAVLATIALRSRRRVGTELFLVALVVAAALAVYGSGLVHPPDAEELLLDVGDTFGHWSYLLVGGLAFLETGAFVGLLAPGEVAVIAGGVFAGQGNLEVVLLVFLVWACCAAGDSISFWIGRRLGRGFLVRHGHRVLITEPRLKQVEAFFARRGGITILIGRFIGFVRPLAPFVAGASRMRYSRFVAFDLAGSGLWATTFVLLGYFSWRNIDKATQIASRGSLAIGTTVSLVVVVLLVNKFLRTAEQRDAARRWLRERRSARHNAAS